MARVSQGPEDHGSSFRVGAAWLAIDTADCKSVHGRRRNRSGLPSDVKNPLHDSSLRSMFGGEVATEARVNSKEFERKLAFLSGWTRSEIDQRTRPLRDAGYLDRGAGRHTPDLSYAQATTILLSLVARRATDTMDVLRRVLQLRAVLPPDAPQWLEVVLEGDRLGEVLSVVLASPDSVAVVDCCIPTDGSFAWVTLRRGSTTQAVWFTASEADRKYVAENPDTYSSQGGTYLGHSFTMGEGAFDIIALALRGKVEGGWVTGGEQ